jgi:predicted DNA-binding transcriptional regulator AlpA
VPRILLADELPSHGIKLSDAQRRRLETQHLFPRRVQITARSYGYVEAEIADYIVSRIAARDAEAARVA